MKVKSGSHLLFIGDSVTDCDRARPVGSGSAGALGHGYVAEVASTLALLGADRQLRLTNMGTSGNTVRDLARRWETDVTALAPDWLSVMIGINDVWRQFDGKDAASSVMPDEFRSTYDDLIGRTLPYLKGLVLMSPFYIQAERTHPMRLRMDEYTAIVKELASTYGALFVDVQAAFDVALGKMDYAAIAGDRIHPTPEGHRILARAFMGVLG